MSREKTISLFQEYSLPTVGIARELPTVGAEIRVNDSQFGRRRATVIQTGIGATGKHFLARVHLRHGDFTAMLRADDEWAVMR